jgi:hypothetical protein
MDFSLSSKDLASIGIENTWVTENGSFELQVGGSPQKLLKKQFYYKN